jgi:hypothetical protein
MDGVPNKGRCPWHLPSVFQARHLIKQQFQWPAPRILFYKGTVIAVGAAMKNTIRKSLLSGCALALCFVAPAQALVIGGGDPGAYTTLGSYYTSVGQIQGYDTQGGEYAASGVVIAPNWVLTAGHVVSDATSLNFFLDAGGSWDSFSSSTRTAIKASDWIANPNYNGNLNSGYDIGLIHFDNAFSVNPAVLYTGTSEVGQVGTMVGYGSTGTGSTGYTSFDGLKRAGQNMIDAVAVTPGKGGNRILLSDFDSGSASDNSYGSASSLLLESLIAPGDSGGGLFTSCGTSSYLDDCLVGITSFGWGRLDGDPNSDYGDVGGFTRVSSFISWINSVIGSPSSGGGGGKGGKPHGASALEATSVTVPEPVTFSVFGMGLLGAFALRRRRKAN